ncbi:hypothetical protein KIPB_009265 [Kipferlia bialata]|uniref:Uncharacterized protein n=1 Tax=Kipferlia bialata TaxID=797122 RepID=A0A9K3D3D7_9EUKA|nr:hypothetical protein KIPB_009265 [Kipferlia bialata]|eukprot:g9265.t1
MVSTLWETYEYISGAWYFYPLLALLVLFLLGMSCYIAPLFKWCGSEDANQSPSARYALPSNLIVLQSVYMMGVSILLSWEGMWMNREATRWSWMPTLLCIYRALVLVFIQATMESPRTLAYILSRSRGCGTTIQIVILLCIPQLVVLGDVLFVQWGCGVQGLSPIDSGWNTAYWTAMLLGIIAWWLAETTLSIVILVMAVRRPDTVLTLVKQLPTRDSAPELPSSV